MSPLCLMRSIWWSVRAGSLVSGHSYALQAPYEGQPKCVTVVKCDACSTHSIAWTPCARCGHGEG